MEWKLCRIVASEKPDKKYDAIFRDKKCPCSNKKDNPECGAKQKIVSFGAKGMSDYTKHKDPERKQRYLERHEKNENWDDPLTPGALSRWILWNKPTLKESIDDFKKRFDL